MKISEIPEKDLTAALEKTLSDITDFLGLELEYDYNIIQYSNAESEERELLEVTLRGDQDSALIGYHGKTLDRMQHLLSMALSRRFERIVKVVLDINDYRKNRKSYLENLARRAQQQVQESGQEMELEPMPPAERRIIHEILSQESGVVTESLGENEDRRVIVKPA